MKQFFASAFDGNRVALYYVSYIILCIVFGIIFSVLGRNPLINHRITFYIMYIIMMIVILAAWVIILFLLIQHFLETLSLGRDNVQFDGYLQEVAPKMAIWFLLTIVSCGIYYPWFYRNLVAYFSENTSFKNEQFKFNGSGFVLFVIMMVYAIFIVIYGLLSMQGPLTITYFLGTQFFFMVLSCPLVFLIINWMLNFQWGDEKTITYEGNFLVGIGIIALNMLLSMVTFGLYVPAAYIKIYGHFANNIVIRRDHGLKIMELGFNDNNVSEGYMFIIGQYLLVSFTMGIYAPWALAKVIPWFVGETYLVDITKRYEDNHDQEEQMIEIDEDGEQIFYYDD